MFPSPVCKLNADDLGHIDVVSTAAHCNRNVKAACAHCEHAETACRGCVAVGADKRFAGYAEAFKVNLVADAVAGAREAHAVLFRYRLDISVVVCVFKACLIDASLLFAKAFSMIFSASSPETAP